MSAPIPPAGAPGPFGPSSGGTAAIDPAEARTFVRRVDALSRGVVEAHEALSRLGEEPLPVGSGQDNVAIASWYRELLVADTVPAARRLADDIEGFRRSVGEAAVAWEQADGRVAGSFRPDAGPT